MKLYQCKGRLKVVNMKKEMQNYTQNRELSWLKFNQRVLEEAKDSSVPLLERMKFVSIFTSNLDEFFMIRVGSLYDMSLTDNSTIDSRSGMNPKEQLDAIFAAVAPLYKERDKTYSEIKKLLNPYGVCGLSIKELEQQEKKYVKKYFKDQILPILSPHCVPTMRRPSSGSMHGTRPTASSGQTRKTERVSIPGQEPSDGTSWR